MQRIGVWGVLVLALIFGTGQEVQSKQKMLKIGYVNIDSVLARSTQFKVGAEQLADLNKKYEAQLQSMDQAFAQKQKDYENKRMLLSDDRRQEMEQELAKLQQDGMQFVQEKQQELAQRDAEIKTPIFRKIREILDRVGKADKFDLILQQAVYVGADFLMT